jgi:WD40 repeat protein
MPSVIKPLRRRRLAEASAEAEAQARGEAETQRAVAQENEATAVAEAERADTNAAVAKARELAASAITILETDPALATLLALQALDTAPPGSGPSPEGLISLRQATDANLLRERLLLEGSGHVGIDFVPHEMAVVVASEFERSVARHPIGSLGNPTWVYQDLTTNDTFHEVSVNPEGTVVAVIIVDDPFSGDPGPEVVLDDQQRDRLPGRILLLDAGTGELLGAIPLDECLTPVDGLASRVNQSGFSPGGTMFHVLVEALECNPDAGFVGSVVLDVETWSELARFGEVAELSFTADDSLALVHYPFERAELRAPPGFAIQREFDFMAMTPYPPRTVTISPDGSTLFIKFANGDDARPSFWDLESATLNAWGDAYPGTADNVIFGPTGFALVSGPEKTVLYDPTTGLQQARIDTRGVESFALSSDGSLAATGSGGGTVEVWDFGADSAVALAEPDGSGIWWVNANWILEGVNTAIRAFVVKDPDLPPDLGFTFGFLIIDEATGEHLQLKADVEQFAQLADGRFVTFGTESIPDDSVLGPLAIWDPVDDSLDVLQNCRPSESELPDSGAYTCPDGDPLFEIVVSSTDGRYFAVSGRDPTAPKPELIEIIRIWDVETLEVVRDIRVVSDSFARGPLHFGDGWLLVGDGENVLRVIDAKDGQRLAEMRGTWRAGVVEEAKDGSAIFLGDESGRVWEYETAGWNLVRDWEAVATRVRGMAISDDGARVAVSGEDGFIVVWGLESDSPIVVDRIPALADRISDVLWIDEMTLGAVLLPEQGRAAWQIINLDPEVVADQARGDLIRAFTAEECVFYRIDPCPTLEEIKSR